MPEPVSGRNCFLLSPRVTGTRMRPSCLHLPRVYPDKMRVQEESHHDETPCSVLLQETPTSTGCWRFQQELAIRALGLSRGFYLKILHEPRFLGLK